MATQPMVAEQIVQIPLTDIVPSKTNPRGTPSPEGLDDLAADIERRGVRQAITVRPTKTKGKFVIVFGERRWRASGKANKESIPCVVRDLSDEEAYEEQVIENLQREDLHPLDEAAAFKRLYDQAFKQTKHHDETIKIVAQKLGKKHSPEFIAQRLKLNDLDAAAKEAFRNGDLLPGHANELARLRLEEQKLALDWLLKKNQDVRTPAGWKKMALIPGVPELRLWIQQNLFLDLTKAPFNTSDPNLNPEIGPCITCPFKTGNQPALFGDVQKDETCTVPACWSTKRNNHLVQIATAKAKELGVKKVLKVGLGYATWNHGKVPVDVYIEYNSGARIVKPGKECKDTKPGIVTWIAHPSDATGIKEGDSVLVCPKATECEQHKNVDSRAERKPKSFEQMAETRITNLHQDLPQKVRAAVITAVVQAALKQEAVLSRKHPQKFRLIAEQMHSDLFFDRHRDLCKLMGVEPQLDRWKSKDWRGSSRKIFERNPVALMVAMTIMHQYHADSYTRDGGDPLAEFVRLYRINTKTIQKRVKDATTEKVEAIKKSLKKRKAKQQMKASL